MALSTFPPAIRNAIYQAMGLQEEENDQFSVKSGSVEGQNFLGEIRCVELGGKSVIIKIQPEGEFHKIVLQSDKLFTNEANFYNHILPRLRPITAAPMVFPKAIYSSPEVIVMENLTKQGYQTVPRGTMNIALAKILVKGMAALHASGMAVKHLAPKDFDLFRSYVQEIFVNPSNKLTRNLFESRKVADLVGGDDEPELISKFSPYVRNGLDILAKLIKPDEGETYVTLCHSDMWTNNVLIRYEKDEPVSMALLDFQVFRVASPVTDLLYFIYICTDSTFRKAHLKTLIEDYYSTLVAQIKDYNLDPDVIYPERIFQCHLKKYINFGLLSAVMMLPLLLLDEPLPEIVSSDKLPPPAPVSKAAAERIKDLFKDFLQKGLRPF